MSVSISPSSTLSSFYSYLFFAPSLILYSSTLFFLHLLSHRSCQVKALSSKRHMAVSQQVDASFVIKPAACVPRFDVQEGLYVEGMSVSFALSLSSAATRVCVRTPCHDFAAAPSG